ncbi:MAG: N-6 DNA methylase, partial [Paludibacteraceae bacterium]|nr:N-6 DNA methylase [Paludibacteraceae bacterium]
IPWNREAKEVEAEYKKGNAGRFAPGLPSKSDGQMLFLLNGVAKLKDDGQMAIIQNGSSLFTGDAGSGQSEIRRYLIENDWLDAIVQLPTNAFYNTGIATYIWIVTKNKPIHRRGKVQLIDASGCGMPRRKNIGSKNTDISQHCREVVVKAYGEFSNGTFEGIDENGNKINAKSKIIDVIDFGYNKITVESPETDESGNIVLKKGKPVADSAKRDTENVPLAEDIDDYFEREVVPYNPNAWIDKKKTKVGYEIPFTRTFYEYKQIESSEVIAIRIEEHERSLMAKLHNLFGEV